jgi:hypothetical protein
VNDSDDDEDGLFQTVAVVLPSHVVKASSDSNSPRTPSHSAIAGTQAFPNCLNAFPNCLQPPSPIAILPVSPSTPVKSRRPSLHQLPIPEGYTPQSSTRSRHSRQSSRASVMDSPLSVVTASLGFDDESTSQRDELSVSPNLGLASVRRNVMALQQQGLSRTPSGTPKGLSSMKGRGSHSRKNSLLLKSTQQQVLMGSVRVDMPFDERVQLDAHPERWADWTTAASNIAAVWDHYDVNGNGELDRPEINQLASDVVERYCILYEEQLVREHKLATQKKNKKGPQPELSPEEIKRLMKKDVFPHLLPGKCAAQAKLGIAEKIIQELDVNKDGIITRTKFLFQWRNASKQLLTIHTPEKAKMACTIL